MRKYLHDAFTLFLVISRTLNPSNCDSVNFTNTEIAIHPESGNLENPTKYAGCEIQKTFSTPREDHEYYLSLEDDLTFGCAVVSILTLQGLVLYQFGQPLISTTGQIKFWDGDIFGAQNSQQMTDWYSFTHILHGFLLYYASGLAPFPTLDKRSSVRVRYLVALGVEAGWEVAENSPTVIQRYRQSALAQGYNGDSIINSICDSVGMTLGFVLAAHLHPLAILGIVITEELILGAIIRDNLLLNVIQLIHPFKSISDWQSEIHQSSRLRKGD